MNILQQLIAHKAAVALTGAAVGVVLTAVFATKEAREHDAAILEAENDKDKELTNAEMTEMMVNQGFSEEEVEEFKQYDLVPDDFEYLSKKEKAIIFAKTHWKTGLSMAVTFGLMIFSHVSMAKELAAVGAALGIAKAKYKELDAMLKEKFPDAHDKVHKFINQKNARKELSKEAFKKEETYDGREKFYEPWTNQIFFAKRADVLDALDETKCRLINGGSATIYDFLCSLPPEVKVIKEPWMQHFGWYTGTSEETTYEYNSGFFGPYLKHKIEEQRIIYEGNEVVVHTIDFEMNPDIEPDMPASIEMNTEDGLKMAAKRDKAA